MNLAVPTAYAPHLKIGTCSWKYDSWKGLIYPPDAGDLSNRYLAEYVKDLGTVEVDQWFWSLFPSGVKLPDPATVRAYAESVPDDFSFAVTSWHAARAACHAARWRVRWVHRVHTASPTRRRAGNPMSDGRRPE